MRPWYVLMAAVLFGLGAGAAFADDEHAAREQVGKPVQQAQSLLRQKNYAEALARLKAADAVPDKSAYESYVIEETRAVALIDSGDYVGAVTALDAVLATHILPQADAAKRRLSIVQLDFRLKDYAKTVDAAQRYYQEGGSGDEPRRLMAQSYYLRGDFGNAAHTIRQILTDDARVGKMPNEALLLSLAGSEFKLKNQDGYVDALELLVAARPTHDYWVDLCRAVLQKPSFAARLRLDLDRLEIAAGALDTAEEYVDAAQRALERGFPGDARAFLDKGYNLGALGKGVSAERQKRLADLARRQSDEDQRNLPVQAREAETSANGVALEKLGEAYASYGRHDEALAALIRAHKKGGLIDAEDARLHLGIAYLSTGHISDAKTILNSVTGADGTKDLARMWLILSSPR